MFAATQVEVSRVGELVILQVGNVIRSMEFERAIKLAAQMQAAGKLAKRVAGDDSHRYRMAGTMTDAAAPPAKQGRFQQLPERVRDVGAHPVGTLVQVRMGSERFDMDYNAAFQIAQWLRVHGKMARNEAGETAHWTKIGEAAEAAARLQ